jgi:hypothetical protein
MLGFDAHFAVGRKQFGGTCQYQSSPFSARQALGTRQRTLRPFGAVEWNQDR